MYQVIAYNTKGQRDMEFVVSNAKRMEALINCMETMDPNIARHSALKITHGITNAWVIIQPGIRHGQGATNDHGGLTVQLLGDYIHGRN